MAVRAVAEFKSCCLKEGFKQTGSGIVDPFPDDRDHNQREYLRHEKDEFEYLGPLVFTGFDDSRQEKADASGNDKEEDDQEKIVFQRTEESGIAREFEIVS